MITELKDIITSVNAENDITLVTVYNLPNRTSSLSNLFTFLAKDGVNVDMISLNPSQSATQTVSFSANDFDLSNILTTVGSYKNSYPDIRMDVNTKNCKFTFAGEGMRERCGVAAFVFDAFAKVGIEIKLITTSETKISCLIDEADYTAANDMLEKAFDIKNI